MLIPSKKIENKETNNYIKLLKVSHMSRPKLLYIGYPISISKPVFLNICGPPHECPPMDL